MRALFSLLLLAALAVGLAVAARYNEGYLLLVVPPWRIELSLNLFVLLLLATVLVVHLVLRALAAAMTLPAAARNYRARQRREDAQRALHAALRLSFEGRYAQAIKQAEKAHAAGCEPELAALLAWRAAAALRDETRAARWAALAGAKGADVAGDGAGPEPCASGSTACLMTAAELALERQDFAAARAALARLPGGRHIAALRLDLRARQGLHDWPAVLTLAGQLQKHRALSGEQAGPLLLAAARALLRAAGPEEIESLWARLPASLQREVSLVGTAVERLLQAGRDEAAAAMIERALDEQWDDDLVALYGHCLTGDVAARLARAESWLPNHADDAVLLCTLGRFCRTRELWGKAQGYLEAAVALAPTPHHRIELARLYDALGRRTQADLQYRAACEAADEASATRLGSPLPAA